MNLTPELNIFKNLILSKQVINETRLHELMNLVAKDILSSYGLSVYEKTENFYIEYLRNKQLQSNLNYQFEKIVFDAFSGFDKIHGFLKVGQIETRYDPIYKRFLTLLDLKNGNIDEITFLYHYIPDYDLTCIYKDDLPFEGKFESFNDSLDNFNKCLGSLEIYETKIRKISSKLEYPIESIVSKRGIYEDREKIIFEFLKHNSLHLSMLGHFSSSLWKKLQYLNNEKDIDLVNAIRDLLYGNDAVIPLNLDLDLEVPIIFRRNFLLAYLKSTNSIFTMDDFINKLFQLANGSISYQPPNDICSGLVDYCTNKWYLTITGLLQTNEIKYKSGKISITDKGLNYVSKIGSIASTFRGIK